MCMSWWHVYFFTARWAGWKPFQTHTHTCTHSSLILKQHLLFSESRWEGWGKGVVGAWLNGEWVWWEGAIKGGDVCVCVCVLELRMIKKGGNPPSPPHFQLTPVPWMVNCSRPVRWRSERRTKTARGGMKTPVTHQPPPDFLSIDCHTSDGWLVSIQHVVNERANDYSTHISAVSWLFAPHRTLILSSFFSK